MNLSCCVYKRPFDAVDPWTCPECGSVSREQTPEESRRGWALIRAIATGDNYDESGDSDYDWERDALHVEQGYGDPTGGDA